MGGGSAEFEGNESGGFVVDLGTGAEKLEHFDHSDTELHWMEGTYEDGVPDVMVVHNAEHGESLVAISQLEPEMRVQRRPEPNFGSDPGGYAESGWRQSERLRIASQRPFLGETESLKGLLEEDNSEVEAMGTTHAELAGFLKQFTDAAEDHPRPVGYDTFEVHPKGSVAAFHVKAEKHTRPQGDPTSPFGDRSSSHEVYYVTNLMTGQTIYFNGLMPELIGRYGYYGSKSEDVKNRTVPPREIGRMAGIIEHGYGDDDPVIDFTRRFSRARTAMELSELGNPVEGALVPAELHSAEQVDRFMNIAQVIRYRIKEFIPSVGISNAETLMAFMSHRDRNRLFNEAGLMEKLDCSDLPEDDQASLTITPLFQMQFFLHRLNKLGQEDQARVVNAISAIDNKPTYESVHYINRKTADELAMIVLATNEDGSPKSLASRALAKKFPEVVKYASAEYRPGLAALGLIPLEIMEAEPDRVDAEPTSQPENAPESKPRRRRLPFRRRKL